MIIGALEIVYVAIRRIQARHEEGSPRLNPALCLVLLLGSPIHSALLLAAPHPWGLNAFIGSTYPFKNLTWLLLIAIGIASFIAWVGFDRRRKYLSSKYEGIGDITELTRKVVAPIALILSILGLAYLSLRYPVVCLLTFAGLSICLRFVAASEWGRGDAT